MNDDQTSRIEKVREVWAHGSPKDATRQYAQFPMSHPAIVAMINLKVSGDVQVDAYGHLRTLLQRHGYELPFAEAASIGCGAAAVEVGMAQIGFFRHCTSFDLSNDVLEEARALASERGVEGQLTFLCRDLELEGLGLSDLDLVFAHQSVHHISALELLFENISRAMHPSGILHLNEYVGPDRFNWDYRQVSEVNEWLKCLPECYLRTIDGELKDRIDECSFVSIMNLDPSEAIRSSSIVNTLSEKFDIIEYVPVGGTLAMPALAGIAHNFALDDPAAMGFLNMLLRREMLLIASGELSSDFAIITCRRKDEDPVVA